MKSVPRHMCATAHVCHGTHVCEDLMYVMIIENRVD